MFPRPVIVTVRPGPVTVEILVVVIRLVILPPPTVTVDGCPVTVTGLP